MKKRPLSDRERREAELLLGAYEQKVAENPLYAYRPHPKQRAYHEASTSLKGFFGGNQSGKTTAGLVDDIVQAVDANCLPDSLRPFKRFKPPFLCRIVNPGFRQMEGVIFQKIREWVPRSQLVGDSFDKAFDKSRVLLRFKNGSEFDFLTYEQDLDKFGGATRDRLHYDEEPPEDIRREGLMRLMARNGDECFTMTPLFGLSWMYDGIWEPWQKKRLTDAFIVTVDMDDNPYLHPDAKARALSGMTKEEREARKQGRFVHFAGMVYPEFNRHEHVIPEARIPEHAQVYVGIDPGMRHMAAVVFAYLTSEDDLIVFDELALQGHTVEQVCKAIKAVNLKHGTDLDGKRMPLYPRHYVIDPSARNIFHQTGRSDQMSYLDNGIATILGQNSVTDGINRVKERLQHGRLEVMANCTELISEFHRYRWSSPKKTENDPREEPVKKDDHLLDALRYMVASRPLAPQEPETPEHLTGLERARKDFWDQIRNPRPKTPMGGIFR